MVVKSYYFSVKKVGVYYVTVFLIFLILFLKQFQNQEINTDGVTELKDYLDDLLPKETDKFIKEGNILDLSDFDVREAFENLM